MELTGSRGQRGIRSHFYDSSGTIATGGTAQLIAPEAKLRSSFVFENISDTNMFLEFGSARATATLTSGAVSSCSVTNAGFGFSRPPKITFLGGAWDNPNNALPTYTLPGCPCWPAPSNIASARCVMTGSAPNQTVSSITIDNPGSGYLYPPIILIENDPLDPYGCAAPSATVGILIVPNGSYTSNGIVCVTDQISVFCATISKAFTFKATV